MCNSSCRIHDKHPEVVEIYNANNPNADNEYEFKKPSCEVQISGSGIFGVTMSFLSLGTWINGRYGENTTAFLANALDTHTYAMNAAFDLYDLADSPNVAHEDDGDSTFVKQDIIHHKGRFALRICIASRTFHSALRGHQLALALVMHATYIQLDRELFLAERTRDRELFGRLMKRCQSLTTRMQELAFVNEGYSNANIQRQHDELCSFLSTFATEIMVGGARSITASELGRLIIEASNNDPGFETLLKLIIMLGGAEPECVAHTAITLTCVRIQRCRNSDNNEMPLLLGCARRMEHDNSKVTESVMLHQGLQFGTNAINDALENIHTGAWYIIIEYIRGGGRLVNAYDNMVTKHYNNHTQRIGKEVKMGMNHHFIHAIGDG